MSADRTQLRWNGWGLRIEPDGLADRPEVWRWLAKLLGVRDLPRTPAKPLEGIALPAPRMGPDTFASVVGAAHVSQSRYDRAFRALGRSYHDLIRLRAGLLESAPDLVVRPGTPDEVLGVLLAAERIGAAVVPYGGGTSVVGGVTGAASPDRPTISLDTTRLNRIRGIEPMDRLATAEAGVFGPALEAALSGYGVTLGHAPQSFEFSTLGGWIAHRGTGQQSNRYGGAADWLVSARLATPRGFWRTEDFPASAAGPRLGDLVAGSEGTLGVIVDATFRVRPLPQVREYRSYLFGSFDAGAYAVRAIVQSDIPIATARLSDADETRVYRTLAQLGHRRSLAVGFVEGLLRMRCLPRQLCMLLLGFEGRQSEAVAVRKAAEQHVRGAGGISAGRERAERWYGARFHGPYWRDAMLDRGLGVDTIETAARWSNLSRLRAAVRDTLQEAVRREAASAGARAIVMSHLSHSYPDGASLYFTLIWPRNVDREIDEWKAIKAAASEAILSHSGTITHHHGIGEDHAPWLEREKGQLGLELLRAAKAVVDPNEVLNPGKLIGRVRVTIPRDRLPVCGLQNP